MSALVAAAELVERRTHDPIAALFAAHQLRDLVGLAEVEAVRFARQANWTWSEIGEALGTTKQAAHQRFGS